MDIKNAKTTEIAKMLEQIADAGVNYAKESGADEETMQAVMTENEILHEAAKRLIELDARASFVHETFNHEQFSV